MVAPPARPTKSPAFQFYPDQFMGGKPALMEPLETHVYIWLLCLDWNQGGFVEDEKALARWCRIAPSTFRKAWPVVRSCFERRGDRLTNPRLEKERAKQEKYSSSMSENGKKGGRPRKPQESRGLAAVKPDESIPVSYLLTPETTTTAERPAKQAERPSDAVFEEAWAAYPKRPGNSKAESYARWLAWLRKGVDPLEMLEGTLRYAKYIAANPPEDPRFIKQAQTFFGKGKHFESDWTPAPPAVDAIAARIASLEAEEDAALERSRQRQARLAS